MSKRSSTPGQKDGGGFYLLDVAELPEAVYSPNTDTEKFYDCTKVKKKKRRGLLSSVTAVSMGGQVRALCVRV